MLFNKPYITGDEIRYISEVIASGKISGNGKFTKACHDFFEKNYGFKKCLLTTSCTDAMEMAAILAGIGPGDEVIMPSYTFVSTANPFLLRGAKIVFADSMNDHPNINPYDIEKLITTKTKAIVPVHYAGVSCDMDVIMELAAKYRILVIEDAAQGIDGYYKNQPLGSIGHMGVMSFHDTKNIIAGEGGVLFVNDGQFINRAEIIWEKGTNRSAFFRGEVDKYNWVDVGSSYLPSELIAAFLFAQLQHIDEIQEKRARHWNNYYRQLQPLMLEGHISINQIPDYAGHNYHIFYIVTNDLETRNALLGFLKGKEANATFHYLQLHQSEFFLKNHEDIILINAQKFTNCLIRLPLYPDLTEADTREVCNLICEFFHQKETLPENWVINKMNQGV